VTVECEEGIEEHFQRSLGKDYPKCMNKSGADTDISQPQPAVTTASSLPVPVEKIDASSVTGNLCFYPLHVFVHKGISLSFL